MGPSLLETDIKTREMSGRGNPATKTKPAPASWAR